MYLKSKHHVVRYEVLGSFGQLVSLPAGAGKSPELRQGKDKARMSLP